MPKNKSKNKKEKKKNELKTEFCRLVFVQGCLEKLGCDNVFFFVSNQIVNFVS